MVKLREKEGVEKSTPKKMGLKLPIGVLGDNGELWKNFTIGEIGYEEEEAIGRFQERNPEALKTYTVSKVVSLALKNIGPIKYECDVKETDPIEEAKALNKIGLLNYADIYYIYLRIRMNELGNDYKLDFPCGNVKCEFSKDPGKIIADLSEMDVWCVNDKNILRQNVELLKGLNYRGKVRKSVTVQPMLWMNMTSKEMRSYGANPTLLKLHFMKKCIVGVEGENDIVMLDDNAIKSLRKIDIERISDMVHELNMGPTFFLKGECPKCGFPFMSVADTDYENFFGASSISAQ